MKRTGVYNESILFSVKYFIYSNQRHRWKKLVSPHSTTDSIIKVFFGKLCKIFHKKSKFDHSGFNLIKNLLRFAVFFVLLFHTCRRQETNMSSLKDFSMSDSSAGIHCRSQRLRFLFRRFIRWRLLAGLKSLLFKLEFFLFEADFLTTLLRVMFMNT